jgi:hypothetical protein
MQWILIRLAYQRLVDQVYGSELATHRGFLGEKEMDHHPGIANAIEVMQRPINLDD